jgi:hypothetical protein
VLELERGRVALVGVRTDDEALVIDPSGEGSAGAVEVDPAEAAPLSEEAVESLSAVEVAGDDLPALVASVCGGHGGPGTSILAKSRPSRTKP